MAGTPCRVLKSGKCYITQPYHLKVANWKAAHYGMDLVDYSKGYHALDYVVAHTEGTVIGLVTSYTGPIFDNSWGNYVWIKHPGGYSTLYAHLAYGTTKVKLGQTVKKGQVLAYMDNTGPSYAGHLHWEVRNKSNVRIDPAPYLNADLPGASTEAVKKKKTVKVKVHDLTKKEWLKTVSNKAVKQKNAKTAGVKNHRIGGLAIASPTLRGYCVHVSGNKKFSPKVTGYNTKNHNNGYAGTLKKGIIDVAIDDPNVAYQVKIKRTQKWLGVIYGKDYDLNNPKTGYAGNGVDVIDEIKVWRI